MTDTPDIPSNGELYRICERIENKIREDGTAHSDWHKQNSDKLTALNNNQLIANGRTGNNEKAIALLGDSFAQASKVMAKLQRDRWIAHGVILVVLALGGLFIKLYIADIVRREVSDAQTALVEEIESKYNIEIR